MKTPNELAEEMAACIVDCELSRADIQKYLREMIADDRKGLEAESVRLTADRDAAELVDGVWDFKGLTVREGYDALRVSRVFRQSDQEGDTDGD